MSPSSWLKLHEGVSFSRLSSWLSLTWSPILVYFPFWTSPVLFLELLSSSPRAISHLFRSLTVSADLFTSWLSEWELTASLLHKFLSLQDGVHMWWQSSFKIRPYHLLWLFFHLLLTLQPLAIQLFLFPLRTPVHTGPTLAQACRAKPNSISEWGTPLLPPKPHPKVLRKSSVTCALQLPPPLPVRTSCYYHSVVGTTVLSRPRDRITHCPISARLYFIKWLQYYFSSYMPFS